MPSCFSCRCDWPTSQIDGNARTHEIAMASTVRDARDLRSRCVHTARARRWKSLGSSANFRHPRRPAVCTARTRAGGPALRAPSVCIGWRSRLPSADLSGTEEPMYGGEHRAPPCTTPKPTTNDCVGFRFRRTPVFLKSANNCLVTCSYVNFAAFERRHSESQRRPG